MRRGEFFRVRRPSSHDPKKFRVFIIVSRQIIIDSRFSTVICAPVYSAYEGLSTQIAVGIEEGLKHQYKKRYRKQTGGRKSKIKNRGDCR